MMVKMIQTSNQTTKISYNMSLLWLHYQNHDKNGPDMAINGTGVNEAIAVVLKAARAVAGKNLSLKDKS